MRKISHGKTRRVKFATETVELVTKLLTLLARTAALERPCTCGTGSDHMGCESRLLAKVGVILSFDTTKTLGKARQGGRRPKAEGEAETISILPVSVCVLLCLSF